jgi:hypothetical protein
VPGRIRATGGQGVARRQESSGRRDGTYSLQVWQTGIGYGNRACIQSGLRPCTIWGRGVPASISFASDVTGTKQSTTTTFSNVPSLPLVVGRDFGLRIRTTVNANYLPDGPVTVTDESGVVATGTLSQGYAVVTVPGAAAGTHQYTAHYLGNGSFESSDSDPVQLTTGPADSVTINDIALYESSSGVGSATFTVALSRPASVPLTVNYAVSGVTAVPGVDYRVVRGGVGTLTFNAGQVAKYVTVPILFHSIPEISRTFRVTLSAPSGGYALTRAVGTGTLLEPPNHGGGAAVATSTITEGDSGPNRALRIPIVFTAPKTSSGSFTVTISSRTATGGNKANGADFGGVTVRNLYYTAGTVEKVVIVPIFPDTNSEGDETFVVTVNPGPAEANAIPMTIAGEE